MAKAELILKLIGSTPQSILVESYKTNIPDGSESDFQKILELKVSPLKLDNVLGAFKNRTKSSDGKFHSKS